MSDMAQGQFISAAGSLPVLEVDGLAQVLMASCDIALIIDPQGEIVDLAVGSDDLRRQNLQPWVGQTWQQIVAIDSVQKVTELLDSKPGSYTQSRQINHVLPNGRNRLIEYRFLNFDDQPNRIAVGRDFGALERVQQQLIDVQHLMERDHHQLRQCETRYRVLLQTSSEAMLVVDGRSERVLEANPAAGNILGIDPRKLVGQALSRAFDKDAKPIVAGALANAATSNDTINLRLGGDEDRASLSMSLSRFRAGDITQLLVRLETDTPAGGERASENAFKTHGVFSFFQNAPDALVVTDPSGTIMTANSAFADLVELPEHKAVVGKLLSTWLGRQSVDYQIIMNSLRDKHSLSLFRTEMLGQYGSAVEVELSARATDCSTSGETYGFCIRNVSRRTVAANDESLSSGSARSADQLAELVGQVPLKDLVRESTEVIEQLSIEAALRKTGNNRASAAELLGVSRQSLYVKLRRYGLESGPDV